MSTRKHLGEFLSDELAAGHIDFHLRVRRESLEIFGAVREVLRFYIHPQNASGDTQDYFIVPSENAALLFVDQLASSPTGGTTE